MNEILNKKKIVQNLRLRWNDLRLLANMCSFHCDNRSFQWLDLLFCLFLSEAQMKRCVGLKAKNKILIELNVFVFRPIFW